MPAARLSASDRGGRARARASCVVAAAWMLVACMVAGPSGGWHARSKRTWEAEVEIALGRRADYTLRGVLHLARQRDGELQPARMIAAATDVPANWLPQLLSTLVTAGLVESETGRRGGYRLAVAPADITVLAVIDAVEPDRDATCVLRGGPCHWEDRCAFHEPWADAKQALRDRLAMTTFADIVAIDDLLASGSGHPSGG